MEDFETPLHPVNNHIVRSRLYHQATTESSLQKESTILEEDRGDCYLLMGQPHTASQLVLISNAAANMVSAVFFFLFCFASFSFFTVIFHHESFCRPADIYSTRHHWLCSGFCQQRLTGNFVVYLLFSISVSSHLRAMMPRQSYYFFLNIRIHFFPGCGSSLGRPGSPGPISDAGLDCKSGLRSEWGDPGPKGEWGS